MAIGNRTYVDPGPVLQTIVDDNENQILVGDQRDLREFNEIFLSRITDAAKHQLEQNKMFVPMMSQSE